MGGNMAASRSESQEATYKILVLGDSNVGKTCLIYRFCDGAFHESYVSTIGIDCKERVLMIDDERMRLRIWDTAGQERFRTLTTAYYRGAQGILLVYDITNAESFSHITYWLRNIDLMASPDTSKVIIGNKCDKSWCRMIDEERGRKLAETYNLDFFETSSKTNVNVSEAFETLASRIKEVYDKKRKKLKGMDSSSWDSGLPSKRGSWCAC